MKTHRNRRRLFRRPSRLPVLSALAGAALGLAACGGGGTDGGGFFAITGALEAGGVPVTICIDDAAFTDPATDKGKRIAANLAAYYGVVGGYTSQAAEGQSCRDRFGLIAHLLSTDDYNKKVLPALAQKPSPDGETPSSTGGGASSGGSSGGDSSDAGSSSGGSPGGGSPTAPPVTPRACAGGGGAGTDGLELYGSTSYTGLPQAAGSSGTVTLDPGEIRFSNPNMGPAATTGSLRIQLWAVPGNYTGGSISGFIVATLPLRFTNGGTQLGNDASSNLVTQVLSARTPAAGSYCMVITFEEYSSNCAASDRYCIVDWAQFDTAAIFR